MIVISDHSEQSISSPIIENSHDHPGYPLATTFR